MLALTGKWGALGVDGVRTESGLDAAPQCSSIGLPSHTLAAPRTLFACVKGKTRSLFLWLARECAS